ncbi:MAG: SPOR domain-containing protein, partial [Pararheinheimera sp.]|nr:SPOR domain-containing protein [Rheinheimera sp.]
KRLVALEGDLKELIVALDTMGDQQYADRKNERLENDNVVVSTTEKINFAEAKVEPQSDKTDVDAAKDNSANEPVPAQHSEIQTVKMDTVQTEEQSPAALAPSNTDSQPSGKAEYSDFPGYAIQLASLKNINAAKSVWDKLQKRHASVLEQNSAIVEHALVNNAEYYRLKAIGFDSRAKANDACNIIREQGSSCIVAAAEGEPLEQLIAGI